MAAMVVVTAIVAVSFGGYATSLFMGEHASGEWDDLFTTPVLVAMLAVSLVGATFGAIVKSVADRGDFASDRRTGARKV